MHNASCISDLNTSYNISVVNDIDFFIYNDLFDFVILNNNKVINWLSYYKFND